MSALIVLTCDACGQQVKADLDAGYPFAKTTMREFAKERYGWKRVTRDGKKVDLCVLCLAVSR